MRLNRAQIQEISTAIGRLEAQIRGETSTAVSTAHRAAYTEDGRSALGSELISKVPEINARLAKIFGDVDHNVKNIAESTKDTVTAVTEILRRHQALDRRVGQEAADLTSRRT